VYTEELAYKWLKMKFIVFDEYYDFVSPNLCQVTTKSFVVTAILGEVPKEDAIRFPTQRGRKLEISRVKN
jgi:hypothetical protein